MLSLSFRSEAAAKCHQALALAAGRECISQTLRSQAPTGAGATVTALQGAGGSLSQALIHGLEAENQVGEGRARENATETKAAAPKDAEVPPTPECVVERTQ